MTQASETPIQTGKAVGRFTPLEADPRESLLAALPPKKVLEFELEVKRGKSAADEDEGLTTPAGPTGCFSSTTFVPTVELFCGKSFSS